MILEGLVTTVSESGKPHLAPMGPIVDEPRRKLILRPFPSSTTYANLRRHGLGVFHVTDDVELLARAAVGRLESEPAVTPTPSGLAYVLQDCCRWFEFRVAACDESGERMQLECDVIGQGRVRDFVGFNRAKHAVLEAAILATRWHLLPRHELFIELDRLRPLVEKTGGEMERIAFSFLRNYLLEMYSKPASELLLGTNPP